MNPVIHQDFENDLVIFAKLQESQFIFGPYLKKLFYFTIGNTIVKHALLLLNFMTNESKLKCPKCFCVVFAPFKAELLPNHYSIPLKSFRKEETLESIPSFVWKCSNMLDFENVGFSNDVNGIKFLICADCEIGPLGWYDPSVPNEFCIAQDRVIAEK